MVFNSGTGITDHIDMLDKLTEVVTSRNLTAVAVNAGGTGHAVGDIIEITATGSTSTIVAQLEVTSVSGGVIDGIRSYRGGAYTVDPTTTTANAQSGTSGSGVSATFDLTFSAASWSENRRTKEASSATVAVGGSGYSVGDLLTVTLGDGVQGDGGVDAVFRVATLSGSAVATVDLTGSAVVGNYEETPTNAVATTNNGSGDDACTLTVTWVPGTKANNDGQVAMLQGNGLAGADEVHVMIKTFTQANGFDDAFNWSVMGAAEYNALLPIHQQVGVNAEQINTGSGALPTSLKDIAGVVLKDADGNPNMEWWINHNGRRIILVVKVEGAATVMHASMYAGFLNPLATDTEYPYPLWICGNSNVQNRLWTETSELTGGIVEVISDTSGDPEGPGYLKLPDGTWLPFAGEISGTPSARTVETEFGIYPFLNAITLAGADQTVSVGSDVDWAGGSHDIIPNTGVPGTPGVQLKPTPGTGDPYYWLVAPIVIRGESGQFPTKYNMFGEIADVFWFSTGNNVVVSGDRFELGTKRYTIFQNGNRTQVWSYFAMDED